MKREKSPPGVDLLNSRLTYNYSTYTVGIIGQWIDDNFELHQEVVGFEHLREHYTGENMASIVIWDRRQIVLYYYRQCREQWYPL